MYFEYLNVYQSVIFHINIQLKLKSWCWVAISISAFFGIPFFPQLHKTDLFNNLLVSRDIHFISLVQRT